jgi:16S rRNA (guanine527-N7)-methyltransferase
MVMETLIAGAARLGVQLTAEQAAQFETYYRELVDWNQRFNLTRITGYEEAQVKHFLDSLTVCLAWPSTPAVRFVDIGSGAGLPGIPLKIVYPDAEALLLEATTKKTVFLKHVVGVLGLSGVEVHAGRAEDVARDPAYRERFDLALARAVASLPALVEMGLPFCAVGGRFVAQKKGDITAEVAQSLKAARLMGGRVVKSHPVDLPELADGRYLIIYEKTARTPGAYPRRPGLPASKPLL